MMVVEMETFRANLQAAAEERKACRTQKTPCRVRHARPGAFSEMHVTFQLTQQFGRLRFTADNWSESFLKSEPSLCFDSFQSDESSFFSGDGRPPFAA